MYAMHAKLRLSNKINYENLARGDRTLFINVKQEILIANHFTFEWPKI